MNLILWRHAEAEPGTPDLARNLTGKGKRQASAMAAWLTPFLPKGARILVSPANRTRQTADALGLSYELCKEVAPDADAQGILHACGWPGADESDDTVVVVGHQPALGQTAALLMTQSAAEWSMKKGAVWWLSNRVKEGAFEVIIKAAMSPDLLRVK
ncbi:histidine phosphatase family protein [Noviherbaspirillum cavernae]|uniref:Histidine phosphatase family protein n=1 Tax=Noviherbaspirillum cavernae TaxID=2320862 RepID=A0A418X6E2_9BURK|nr:histidine phosphatase family protein [Noviherbaspirillum cavernae]RJG07921.1 histidine phosphatase family protein [Noviherbaspirillum cavernae]